MIEPLPFQRQFLAKSLAPKIRIGVLSLPRGNGKSTLAAHVLERCLTPGDELHEPGKEYLLLAGSIEQARHVFKPIRDALEPCGEYRFVDSQRSLGVTDKRTNTKLRVVSSNGKTAMGIVNTPILVADEPGSWEVAGGQLMWSAISTALGKPDSTLRVLMIGTVAPSVTGWWADLVAAGSRSNVHVTALQGDPKRFDDWGEVKRVNPLMARFPESRRQLRIEMNDAGRDTQLRARFASYRMNKPTQDESELLLMADDWRSVLERPVAERDGRCVVGIDLGGSRAWSSAVALWESGRCEAVAITAGLPGIPDQERRDRQSAGTYQRLVDDGQLRIAEGLRVPPVGDLVDEVFARWPDAEVLIADRFRAPELEDCSPVEVVSRISRWSESSADIRSFRKLALDGDLSIEDGSRRLLTTSLMAAQVRNDDAGNVRLQKSGTNNQARDDVIAAAVLAAGEMERRRNQADFPFMLLPIGGSTGEQMAA